MNCRFCKTELNYDFVDLGFSPPSNSFLTAAQLNEPEMYYPLKIKLCDNCFLVQIDEFAKHDDIFNDSYVYYSSFSTSWLDHAKKYTEKMVSRFGFGHASMVVEIASNDGYLLQYFKANQIPVLGIEPTANTAKVAEEKGIETCIEFFGSALAEKLISEKAKADLLIGNNVLAHVPDINDFIRGMKIMLNDKGVITMEFPHLLKLIEENQFDTIYHEHFSYLSLYTVKKMFEYHGLRIFDVEELPTHGGSLRVYATHLENNDLKTEDAVNYVLEKEQMHGLRQVDLYTTFQQKSEQVKNNLLTFLLEAKQENKKVVAYGAAAKGNTLLNFAGIKQDLLPFVIDASPYKQGKFLPGSHLPVEKEYILVLEKPDYIIILPWNLKHEISEQLSYTREWGARFVVAVPELLIF